MGSRMVVYWGQDELGLQRLPPIDRQKRIASSSWPVPHKAEQSATNNPDASELHQRGGPEDPSERAVHCTKRRKTENSTVATFGEFCFDTVIHEQGCLDQHTADAHREMVRGLIVRRLKNTAWVFLSQWQRQIIQDSIEYRLSNIL